MASRTNPDPNSSTTALIFAGGEPVVDSVIEFLPSVDLVIGADSGVEHALRLGFAIDLAVGDFDSLSSSTLDTVTAAGTEIETHPIDKDATDLELAIDAALVRGITSIVVIGGHGGRLDHFLANAQLLTANKYAAMNIEAWFGVTRVTVVRHLTELSGSLGSTISLLAPNEPALGVTTTGLRFALLDSQLLPGSTLGVSNEFTELRATVNLKTGTVLAVQPNAVV